MLVGIYFYCVVLALTNNVASANGSTTEQSDTASATSTAFSKNSASESRSFSSSSSVSSSSSSSCVETHGSNEHLKCNGDRNATYKKCPAACPRTCEIPNPALCSKMCVSHGCECKQGYYLDNDGKCVEFQDCSAAKSCGKNESYVYCKFGCPTNNCPLDDSRAIVACSPPYQCQAGCACKGDYLRLNYKDGSRCILASECPPVQCKRPNEEWNPSPKCLAEYCSDIDKPTSCDRSYSYSRPQCVCKQGFYRNQTDICVPAKECLKPPPKCGYNEMAVECKTECPPQSCENSYTEYRCGETKCEAGCDCLPNYLRNSSGICIPNDECPPPPTTPVCNENEIPADCKIDCPPQTCESVYTSYLCINKTCEPGCNCIDGYLRNASNLCIPSEQCPPPNICGVNETYADCGFRCPNQYCPEDDSGEIILCKPDRNCKPGCLCKPYYKRISQDNDACVLSSDCPPINCTRPHEIWDPCSSECLAERCEDINNINDCYPDPKNCQPKCVCAKGYFRDVDGVCIPVKKCPNKCDVPKECRPTCAIPNPRNCAYVEPATTNVDGCKCQTGYILAEVGGKCIKIEECPTNLGCNGDPHAIVKECPRPCPSICAAPNGLPCKRKCVPVGCACEPGYILSEVNGKCILPDQCEGGNPCGQNGTFVNCKADCPTNYCPVDDNRGTIICETYPFSPCYSGCVCKINYRRKSYKDDICILASECPPVNCTRPNETWNSCPSDCLSEYCEDVDKKPSVCNTLLLNCQPKCICNKNYFRNASEICISANECRELNMKPKCSS